MIFPELRSPPRGAQTLSPPPPLPLAPALEASAAAGRGRNRNLEFCSLTSSLYLKTYFEIFQNISNSYGLLLPYSPRNLGTTLSGPAADCHLYYLLPLPLPWDVLSKDLSPPPSQGGFDKDCGCHFHTHHKSHYFHTQHSVCTVKTHPDWVLEVTLSPHLACLAPP